jgi:hypothetical protein
LWRSGSSAEQVVALMQQLERQRACHRYRKAVVALEIAV